MNGAFWKSKLETFDYEISEYSGEGRQGDNAVFC